MVRSFPSLSIDNEKGDDYMWKDIFNFEGLYQISDSGEVKSLSRWVPNGTPAGMILKERILKPNTATGYAIVTLRKNNRNYAVYVHRLVAEAFLTFNPQKTFVNHIDGNKLNNNASNLEYVTCSENNQHAYDTKLKPKGEQFYNAKLTYEQVIQIRELYPTLNLNQLAKQYNVSRATIRDIILHKTWKT